MIGITQNREKFFVSTWATTIFRGTTDDPLKQSRTRASTQLYVPHRFTLSSSYSPNSNILSINQCAANNGQIHSSRTTLTIAHNRTYAGSIFTPHDIVPIFHDLLNIIAQDPSLFTLIDATRITKNQSILQQEGKKDNFLVLMLFVTGHPQQNNHLRWLANGSPLSG